MMGGQGSIASRLPTGTQVTSESCFDLRPGLAASGWKSKYRAHSAFFLWNQVAPGRTGFLKPSWMYCILTFCSGSLHPGKPQGGANSRGAGGLSAPSAITVRGNAVTGLNAPSMSSARSHFLIFVLSVLSGRMQRAF